VVQEHLLQLIGVLEAVAAGMEEVRLLEEVLLEQEELVVVLLMLGQVRFQQEYRLCLVIL